MLASVPSQDQLSEREFAELELCRPAALEEQCFELRPIQIAVLMERQQDGPFTSREFELDRDIGRGAADGVDGVWERQSRWWHSPIGIH